MTGTPALLDDFNSAVKEADVKLLLATGLLVLILLLAVYRSPLLALLPLTVVAIAFLVATGILYVLAEPRAAGGQHLDLAAPRAHVRRGDRLLPAARGALPGRAARGARRGRGGRAGHREGSARDDREQRDRDPRAAGDARRGARPEPHAGAGERDRRRGRAGREPDPPPRAARDPRPARVLAADRAGDGGRGGGRGRLDEDRPPRAAPPGRLAERARDRSLLLRGGRPRLPRARELAAAVPQPDRQHAGLRRSAHALPGRGRWRRRPCSSSAPAAGSPRRTSRR